MRSTFPNELVPEGLSDKRAKYIYENLRQLIQIDQPEEDFDRIADVLTRKPFGYKK